MLKDVAIGIACGLFGFFVLGVIVKAAFGKRGNKSIRGLLVATALIALALYFIVSTLQLYQEN